MTTASDGVAVIATQVARTDRRALSEAWYSALHLAHDAPPAHPRVARGRAAALPAASGVRGDLTAGVRARATPAPPPRPRRGSNDGTLTAGERRRPATETSRRIGRAVAALAAQPQVPAAHTVDVAGGRVRLLVHTDGRATRIVALCSRPLRAQVERALASARFALAGAGVAVGAP